MSETELKANALGERVEQMENRAEELMSDLEEVLVDVERAFGGAAFPDDATPIGVMADRLLLLNDIKAKANEVAKKISAMSEQASYACVLNMQENGMDKTATINGTVSLKAELYPNIKDNNALFEWAHANGVFGIYQKRLAKGVFTAYFEEHGEYPPGTDAYTKMVAKSRRQR